MSHVEASTPTRDRTQTPSSHRPRVVIVGAGFGGLNAAKALRRAPVDVLMIDQNNYHTFQPLLYQVATAGLEAGDIAHQVRHVFRRQRNFRFRQGTVVGFDRERKLVHLKDDAAVPFDYLILAAGAVYNDFGVPGVREHAKFLKALTEATNLRAHTLRQFERASAGHAPEGAGTLTFVIVGGGPTGVEMAGALSELFERVLAKDFPELDMADVRIVLLEMGDGVLSSYGERSRRYTEAVLRARGVEVRLGTTVAEVREHEVELEGGEVIPTETLIWAAGVRAHPLVEALGLELGRGRRVRVEGDLSLPEDPSAFVVGDMAAAEDASGTLLPQTCPVAIQQGLHAGRQIRNELAGRPRQPFRYFDKGSMAIVGRNAGVAELSRALGGLRMRGFLGWLGWLFIHLIYLPGHQNRFSALTSWAYNYLTYDRHARLITFMRPSPAEVANRAGELVAPDGMSSNAQTDEDLVPT